MSRQILGRVGALVVTLAAMVPAIMGRLCLELANGTSVTGRAAGAALPGSTLLLGEAHNSFAEVLAVHALSLLYQSKIIYI